MDQDGLSYKTRLNDCLIFTIKYNSLNWAFIKSFHKICCIESKQSVEKQLDVAERLLEEYFPYYFPKTYSVNAALSDLFE